MVTLTDTNVRAGSWENVYDAINGGSYTTTTAPIVLRNNSDLDEDDTFPRIVIHPVAADYENIAFGRTRHKKQIKFTIDIYATKNKDLDILGDEVVEILRTTDFQGMHFIGSEEALTIETDVNQKIHLRTITATYIRG